MRSFWFPTFFLGAALAAGCSGSDQTDAGTSDSTGNTNTGTGGTGGDNTAGSNSTGGGNTGGGNTGGNNTGGSNTGGNGAGGSATGGNNTGGGTGGGTTTTTCGPITPDASKIGTDCAGSMNCPDGYTCQAFAGIVVSYYCAILCQEDCECPGGTTCEMKSDKGSQWMECTKP